MNIGYCKDCKHFVPGEGILGGLAETNSRCVNHMITNGAMTQVEAMYVDPDFGCIRFEEKETEHAAER